VRLIRVMRRVLVVLLMLCAGCGHEGMATVSGSLREVGGPSGAADTVIPGTVAFASHGATTVATAHTDGTFSVSLAPGTYDVVGTSPHWGDGKGRCIPDGPVVVGSTGVTGLVVACPRR
jgi:hypothetical protein